MSDCGFCGKSVADEKGYITIVIASGPGPSAHYAGSKYHPECLPQVDVPGAIKLLGEHYSKTLKKP